MNAAGPDGGADKGTVAPVPRRSSGWIDRVLERSTAPPRPALAKAEPRAADANAKADEAERNGPPASLGHPSSPPATLAPAPPLPPMRRADDALRPPERHPVQRLVERSTPPGPARPQLQPVQTSSRARVSPEPTPPRDVDSTTEHPAVPATDGAAEAPPPPRLPARQERDAAEAKSQAASIPPPQRLLMPAPRGESTAVPAKRDEVPRRLDPTETIAELAPPARAEAAPAPAPSPPPARIQVGRVTVEITPPPAVAAAPARAPVAARPPRRASGQGTRPSALRFGLGAS